MGCCWLLVSELSARDMAIPIRSIHTPTTTSTGDIVHSKSVGKTIGRNFDGIQTPQGTSKRAIDPPNWTDSSGLLVITVSKPLNRDEAIRSVGAAM